jgi:hypothetical protein
VSKSTVLKYKILHGIHPETYLPSSVIAERSLALDPLDGWITLPILAERGKDGKVYIVFEPNENVTLYTAAYQPIGAVTHRYHTAQTREDIDHDSIPLPSSGVGEYIAIDRTYEEKKNILFKDISPAAHPYAAACAINGYSRPYFTPNLWQPSAPGESLILTTDEPRDIAAIAIAFNTDLSTDAFPKSLPACTAKAYSITLTDENGNESTVFDGENFLRYRKHWITARGITKVKITIKESYGDLPGIYAVKMKYAE